VSYTQTDKQTDRQTHSHGGHTPQYIQCLTGCSKLDTQTHTYDSSISAVCFTDTSVPVHFGPKTLRHLYLVPKCPGDFGTGARHFGTGTEMSQDTSKRCARPTAGESDSADVSMRTHVFRTVSSCFSTLRKLRSIRRSTSQVALLSLVISLVLSHLDYGNATLDSLPGNQLDRLQSVINAAARLVCCARKYEHITPLLRNLHWLRVPERIEFKLSVLVFRCLHGTVPGERAMWCGGRGYKKEAAIFVDVCPLSHHLRVVRRLVTARSSSLRRVPGTLYGRPKQPKFKFFKPTNLLRKSINHFTLSIN